MASNSDPRAPGWYADPETAGQWRWWDGSSWTGHAVSADRGATGPSSPGTATEAAGPDAPAGPDDRAGPDRAAGPDDGDRPDRPGDEVLATTETFTWGPFGEDRTDETRALPGRLGRGPIARGALVGGGPARSAVPGGAFARSPRAEGDGAAGSFTAGARSSSISTGDATTAGSNAGGPNAGGPNAGGPNASGTNAGGPNAGGTSLASASGAGAGAGSLGPGGADGRNPPGRRRGGGGGGAGGGSGGRGHPWPVMARRWAAVVAVVVVIIAVLVVVLRGHPPALYWQGEPITNANKVLDQAESTMKATASANEAVLSGRSRCYFALPNRSTHDVRKDLVCGPVLFPWSSPPAAWLEYGLSAAPAKSGVALAVAARPGDTTTKALAPGTVLRRPDGAVPPKGEAGLAVPVVPYQRPGWAGLLAAPPAGLTPAPVDDVLGGWAHDFRVVAYGEVGHMGTRLDVAALRDALNPPGSKWSTGSGDHDARPLARVLLPARGQVFVVAELAESPGEAAGAVPSGANGSAAAQAATSAAGAALQVFSGTTIATLRVPSGPSSDIYVAASVPVGSRPSLLVSEKGLAQQVSLVNGQPDNVPSVLARLSPNEPLNITGRLPGLTLHATDASLVWFAGSDGGTVPPSAADAYLQVMMTVTPFSASFLPAPDFALRLAGGQVVDAQALPDSDRTVLLMGFVVPASFSTGTVVVSEKGSTLSIPVSFP